MHQSPRKLLPGERGRYSGREADPEAELRFQRGGQPKARKSSLRDDYAREARRDREFKER